MNSVSELDVTNSFIVDNSRLENEIYIALLVICGIGCILMMLWYYVMTFSSAEIYTFDTDNARLSLGRVPVVRKGENYFIKIGERYRARTNTGIFEIQLDAEFIRLNFNRNIIISIGKQSIGEMIRSEIVVKEAA